MMRKQRLSFAFTVLLILLFTADAKAQTEQPKLFVFNLSAVTFDLRLQNKEVKTFEARGVRSNWATRLEPLDHEGEFTLYFKQTGAADWYQWAEGPGSPHACPVLPGELYCIVITQRGEILYLELEEEKTSQPQVCFFNLSGSTLSRIELGAGWQYKTKLELKTIDDRRITDFIPVPAGAHSFFWAYEDNELDHFTYMKQEEEGPERFNLNAEGYYLFALVEGEETDFPLVFDITPYY